MHQTASPYVKELLKGEIKWMPFSRHTLETAMREDKVIFVHIGNISKITEREAAYRLFRNKEVIEKINTHFIPIALDTEDVPEAALIGLDMLIITEQHFTIPINIFSLPGIKPFTSFSSMDIHEFCAVTDNILTSFKHKRILLEKASQYMAERLASTSIVPQKESPRKITAKALHTYVRSWEAKVEDTTEYKKNAPYRINPRAYIFLMKYYARFNMTEKLQKLKLRLDKLYYSGLFDPIDGGFFTTSADYSLQNPLFEKSFSENVQAATMFSLAYRYLGDKRYRIATRQILNFIERELKSPQGGYMTYITLSKEIQHATYYQYSLKELKTHFPDNYLKIARYLGMHLSAGENISQPIANTPESRLFTLSEQETLRQIRREKNEKLYDQRVITGYNCMYICGLCIISNNLGGVDEYIERAELIVEEIINKQKQGSLLLYRYMLSRDKAYINSDLFDYAMFLNMAIRLYKHTQKEKYFILARKYSAYILLNFYQSENGMFSKAPKSEQIAPFKRESIIDYIRFSANSIMARNMSLMHKITGEKIYLDIFRQQLYNVEDQIIGSGPLMIGWTLQMLNYLTDNNESPSS